MTREEYEMTFGEWCNHTQHTDLKLNVFGDIDFRDTEKDKVTDKFYDLWTSERREYVKRIKEENITNALQSLRKEGIKCELCCYQNAHIKAMTKHGVILNYYATTGTIAGYRDTSIEGLEELIRLCKK